MPKYENAVVYKLCCKDPSILDEYVGSTCNKYKRKQNHKFNCNNENSKGYNIPVYQFMRENGGFENWNMIILEEYSCESKVQLCQREREWFEKLRPTLNIYRPIITEEENNERIEEYEKHYYEENREELNEKGKKYRQTKKCKEHQKEFEKSDERKQYIKQYRQTDKFKENKNKYETKYRQTDKRKKYMKEYMKEYYEQKKLKNQSAIIIQRFFRKYLKY